MSATGARKSRAVGAGVTGAVLILLVGVFEFVWPQVRPELAESQQESLRFLTAGVLTWLTWAALTGGAALLVYAWNAWRSEPDGEPAPQEA